MKKLWEDMWTIPFDGNLYLCWREKGKINNTRLNSDQEATYFGTDNQERVLNDIIRNVL